MLSDIIMWLVVFNEKNYRIYLCLTLWYKIFQLRIKELKMNGVSKTLEAL
jgi:hypothetical protein